MKIKNIIFSIIVGLLVALPVLGVDTLWELFHEIGEPLPTVEERIPMAEECGIENYAGTKEQNINLLSCILDSADSEVFGATIPKVTASFESSLATAITSSATTMTLAKGTDDAGNHLSGYMCFTIDEGQSDREFVCGTASSTAVTSMIRGVDTEDGDLEVTALKKAHRRGASVKVTNYPVLGILMRIINGDETLPNKLTYASQPTISADNDIATKKYVDDTSFTGTADSSFTTKGIVEIATKAELASGASASTSDTTAFLVPSSAYYNVTSTATSGAPFTDVDGKLQQSYYDLTEDFTWTGSHINATSTFTRILTAPIDTLTTYGTSTMATSTISQLQGDEIVAGELVVTATSTLATTSLTHLIVNQIELLGEAIFSYILNVTGTSTLATTTITALEVTESADLATTTIEELTVSKALNLNSDAITDAFVVDTLTASNYLPLAGGTTTGAIVQNATGTATLGFVVKGDLTMERDATTTGMLDATVVRAGTLKLGTTAVTSNADEINKLDTTSANVTATNLNSLTDGTANTLHKHAMTTGQLATSTNASGEWIIPHSLGAIPSMIEITAMAEGDSDLMQSIGTATAVGNDTSSNWALDIGAVQIRNASSSSLIILLENANSGADQWAGDLTTLDATNIGITLTKANPNELQIQWKAWY